MLSSQSRPGIIERPDLAQDAQTQKQPEWMVLVYNNEVNTYEEVVMILCLATQCSEEEAYIEAWEVDHFGQCAVHRASEDECRSVARVIATIGIKVEAAPSE